MYNRTKKLTKREVARREKQRNISKNPKTTSKEYKNTIKTGGENRRQ